MSGHERIHLLQVQECMRFATSDLKCCLTLASFTLCAECHGQQVFQRKPILHMSCIVVQPAICEGPGYVPLGCGLGSSSSWADDGIEGKHASGTVARRCVAELRSCGTHPWGRGRTR